MSKTKEEILEPYRQYTQPLSFGLLAADLVSGEDALKAMQEYADQCVREAVEVKGAIPDNDMTVQDFYSGFNLDFMTEEERQTIYTATELFAKGKVRGVLLPIHTLAFADHASPEWSLEEVRKILNKLK